MKWEYNSEKAAQIQELHPEICKEKLVQEKNQKLLKKPFWYLLPIMRTPMRIVYDSFTETSAVHIALTNSIISFVILALFWMFSIPLMYLKYFVIIIGMLMLVMIGTMLFLCWNDSMFYFEHLLYLLDNFGWYFWLVLRFCVLNYVLCISCVNDTYKALWLCLINSCTLKVYIFIKRKIYNI